MRQQIFLQYQRLDLLYFALDHLLDNVLDHLLDNVLDHLLDNALDHLLDLPDSAVVYNLSPL